MLISVHIPKTAGTTFRHILKEIYGDDIYFDYKDQYSFIDIKRPNTIMVLKRFAKELYRYRQKMRSSDRCIHGHFRASKYLQRFPDASIITWLREPVDRIVSHYNYWNKFPDFNHSICRHLIQHNLTLEEFAQIPVMQNLISRYLDGVRIEDFNFVGIMEDYDNSLLKLFTFINLKPFQIPPKNVGNNDASHLDNSTRKLIEKLNEQDLEIYSKALKLFGSNQ